MAGGRTGNWGQMSEFPVPVRGRDLTLGQEVGWGTDLRIRGVWEFVAMARGYLELLSVICGFLNDLALFALLFRLVCLARRNSFFRLRASSGDEERWRADNDGTDRVRGIAEWVRWIRGTNSESRRPGCRGRCNRCRRHVAVGRNGLRRIRPPRAGRRRRRARRRVTAAGGRRRLRRRGRDRAPRGAGAAGGSSC